MKPNRRNLLFSNFFRGNTLTTAIVVSLASFAAQSAVHALDRVWGTNLGAGPWVWNDVANWTGGVAPITNADRGDLRKDWTAGAIINLNAATTINGILFDDTGANPDVGVTIGNGGNAANTLTLAGTSPVMQVDGSTLTLATVVAGSTAWSKTGAGTLALSGANTFTGNVTVTTGILKILNSSALGTSAKTVSVANGTAGNTSLQLDGTAGAINLPAAISLTTSNVGSNGAIRNLAGDNSIAGQITLSSGGGDSHIYSDAGTLTLSGTVTTNTSGRKLVLRGVSTGANTVSGSINNTNTPAVQKLDSGTWILSGTNTYAGGTTLSAGILRATTNASALGAGALSLGGGELQLANNTGLNFNRDTTVTANTIITADRLASAATSTTHSLGTLSIGAQTLTINRGTNITSTGVGGITFGGTTTLTGAATLSASANTLLTLGAVTNGANLLTINGAGNTTITGIIGSGAGGISKSGAGTLTLSGANTFTGNVDLSAGTLNLNSNAATGTSAGTFTITGGTLDNTSAGSVTTAAKPLTLNGNFAFTGTRDLNLGAGATTLNAARTITVNGGTLTLGGAITGATFGITKAGAGTLALNGVIGTTTGGLSVTGGTLIVGNSANTFTGNITVDGATSALQMTSGANGTTAGPLGVNTTNYKTVTLTNGGIFRPMANYNNNAPTAAASAGAGYQFIIGSTGGTFDTPSGVTFTLDDGASADTTAWTSTQLRGSGTLTKTGAGTLLLGNGTSNNTVFTGQILINQGILKLGSMGASGVGLGATSAGTVIASGAALDITNSVSTAAEPLSINGTGVSSGNVIFTSHSSGGSFAGPITLAGNSQIGSASAGAITFSAGATFALGSNTLTIRNTSTGRVFTDGVISGTGSVEMNSSGTGDYVPRADHTYTGDTTLTAGFVAVDRDSIGTTGSPDSGPFGKGTLTLAGGQLRSGTGSARTVGNTVMISADTTFYTVANEKNLTFSGPVTLSGGNRTLTANVGTSVAGASTILSGAIGDGGNNLGLIKAGTGNLTLAGANTYTGGTTVNSGVLNLTGSLAANTALTVAAGGTFSMASGAANPLTSISALNLGAGSGTANLVFDLGADTVGSDRLITSAAATTANTIGINLVPITSIGSPTTYDLISAASGLSGASYALNSGIGGYLYTLNATDSLVQVGVTPASGTGSLYWHGAVNSSWSGLSASGTNTNWTTDAAGNTNAGYNPTTGNTVVFSASSATGPTFATTLNNNYTVNDLQFTASPAGVTAVAIGAGATTPGSLTLSPASSTDGISLAENAGNVTISAPLVMAANQTWSVNAAGATPTSLTISGGITAASTQSLTLVSTGGTPIVTLSGQGLSTYTGNTTIGAGVTLTNGVTSGLPGLSAITVNGTLATGAFASSVGSLAGGSGIVQNGSATNAVLIIGDDNADQSFPGTLQNGGTNSLAITKRGTGTQTFTGDYSYTGNTTINGGTLRFAGNSTGTTAITVNTGGTLQFGSATGLTSLNNITLAGTGTLDLAGNSQTVGSFTSAATTFITNTGSGTGTDTLNINSSGPSLAALITDGLTRAITLRVSNGTGGNQLTTNPANTFSGGLILANNPTGTRITVGTITGTPWGSGPITVGEAATDKAGIFFNTANQTLTNPVIANTGLGTDRLGTFRIDALGTILSGQLTANLAPLTFATNSTGAVTTNGKITGPSGLVLTPNPYDLAAARSLTVTLSNAAGTNDYAGDTVINLNPLDLKTTTLALGAADQIPNGSGKGNVIINTVASGIGTLNLSGFSETINGLSGNGIVDSSSGTPTLTLGDNNATTDFSGVIQNTGGSLAITKIGSGTQTFSGANTFSGPLSVNGGTVAFASSPAASGPLGNSMVVNLSGGGLSYTVAGANNLNRPIAIGAGDGTLNVVSSTGVLNIPSVTSTGGNLIKNGPGSAVIGGSTSLSGGASSVFINDGTLQAGFGTNGAAAISVGSTGILDLRNSAIEALVLGNSAGALTLSGGASLGFELNGLTNDSIDLNLSGTAFTSGVVTLNFFGFGSGVGNTTYNLLTSASGGLNGATYALGSAPNGFNYTINSTANLVSLTTTAYIPIYWRGGQNLSWNTLGAAVANWTSDAAGTIDAASTPGTADTVIFSAAAAPATANTITTTLDGAFAIDSLQFASNPAGITAVTIAPGTGGSLTLAPVSTSGGIRVLNGGGNATISSPLTVGAAQTWDVDPTGSLTVSGDTTFNFSVNKTNTGAVTLSGNNSGTGAINLSGGTLNLGSATALGNGTFTIGAGTTIDTPAGAVALTTNNAQNWNGDFTFTGTNNLDLGTGAVTMANSLTVNTSGSTLTAGGSIGDAGNGRSLTKTGTGTLTLTGNNTYTGGTILTAGTLNLTGNNTFGPGGLTVNGGTATLSGNNTYSGGTTVTSGSLTLSGSNNFGTGGIIVNGGDTTLSGNNTFSGPTNVNGGTLTLSGNNASTGDTTLSSGTLNIGHASALGSGNLTLSGGTLDNSSGSALALATNNDQSWNGNFTFTGTNSLDLGNGNVTLGSTRTVTVSANTLTVGGNVSGGAFGLTKAGAGTLVLNGDNAYTGITTLGSGSATAGVGGTLILSGHNSAATGTVNVGNGSTLQLQSATALGTTGVSGSQLMLFNGATLQLRADSPLIFNGTSGVGGFGNANVTVDVNQLTGSGSNNVLTMSAAGFNVSNTTFNVTGGNGYSLAVGPVTSVAANTSTYNPTTANLSIASYTASVTGAHVLALSGTATANSIPGVITNGTATTMAVTKSGTGTWALSGLSTTASGNYTGTTTIGQGTLAITANDPSFTGGLTFGSAAGNANTGTLDLSSSSATFAGSTLVRTNNATANSIIIGSGKTLTLNGGLTMGYDAGAGTGGTQSNLTASGAGSLSISGTTISIGVNQAATNAAYWSEPTLDVTALGSFSTDVTNFNIGVGSTTQGAGHVLLSNTANAILATTLTVGDTGGNNGRGNSSLILGTGTNLIQADTINIGRGKDVAPNTGFVRFDSQTAGSPGTVTITDKAGTGSANIFIANNNGTATAGGASGSLDLRGHVATVSANTLTIANLNMASNSGNVTGMLSFDAGTFTVATLNMAPKTAGGTGTANATVNVGGGNFTVNTAFTLGSQATAGASVATLNLTGGIVTSNADILDGGGNTTSTINLNGATLDMAGNDIGSATPINNLNFQSGTLKNVAQINNGGTALNKTTAGTLVLSGTNTYSGGTTLTLGTLQIGTGSSLGSVNGELTVNAGTLDLNGNDLGIGNLTGTGGTIVNNLTATNQTLTIGNNDATGGNYAGVIADNTTGTGTIGVTKTGSGTLTLSGINTYTGPTNVQAGMLVVNGSLSGTSGINVANGATVGGNGTLNAATTFSGVVAPGNSIGTLTVNNDVTWNGGATPSSATDWQFELGLGTSDLLDITGASSDFLKGTGNDFRFDFLNTGYNNGTYTLVDWSSTEDLGGGALGTTFQLADFTYVNLDPNPLKTGSFSFNGTSLQFTVIPEPRAAILGILGTLILLRRRRIA